MLGATAIEDRLQDGVPETIADLKEAGIKVGRSVRVSGVALWQGGGTGSTTCLLKITINSTGLHFF